MFYFWLVCLKLSEKKSRNSFELDPAHYLSTPGNSWNAMLRFTNIEEYQFIESTMASVISVVW